MLKRLPRKVLFIRKGTTTKSVKKFQMKWCLLGKWGMKKNIQFSFPSCVEIGYRSLRSDAALEAIAKASEDKVPNIVLYNYPSFSGAFSSLFAHLFHTRHDIPSLSLPFSSVPSLAFRFVSSFFNPLIFLSSIV